ncbi:MAG: hypothetical protein M1404_07535 [Acidobacteria bacterium]|nr:hypothetical protein [Acidobacteriota bacterium]
MKQGGATLLKDVYVKFYGRSGNRYDILRTAEGEYNRATNNLSTPGAVELILNAPKLPSQRNGTLGGSEEKFLSPAINGQSVVIKTSRVSSRDHSKFVESDNAVRFRLGDVSGSARGLSYTAGEGEIVLKKDVKAVFQSSQNRHGTLPIQLSASRLRYDNNGKKVQLWGPVEVRQRNRTVTAEQGVLSLNSHNRITAILLRGKVHASDQTPKQQLSLRAEVLRARLDPENGQLRRLVADGRVRGEFVQGGTRTRFEAHETQLDFSGPGQVPANGKAMGQVRLTIFQPKRAETPPSESEAFGGRVSREELTTQAVRFAFRPGGKSLREAETLDSGTLVLFPENSKGGRRIVTAHKFLMAFDSASRLKTLRGTGGTHIVFQPSPTASGEGPSITSAKQLLAVFDPANEMLRSVTQWGDFRFRHNNLEAAAGQARDLVQKQLLVLSGHPQIWDRTTRAQADQFVLHIESGTAEGIGHVQAVHYDPQKGSSLPTNVVADRMVADRNSQVVVYEGHVRAWQGTDVVESSRLEVYKNQRRVSSGSPVITSLLQPASAPLAAVGGKQAEPGSRPATICADRLNYFDEGHKALYSGHVVLKTQGTKLRADRLEVYFSRNTGLNDSQIERAVAEGHVLVTQPERYVKGNRAIYDAKEGEIVVTGGPPAIYDAEKGYSSGQRLTFYIHNDRVLVDGGPNSPTVTEHRVAQ